LPTLGTVAHDVNALAEKNDDAGLQLRINAMVERERLEDNGIGDELMEMQRNALANWMFESKGFCNRYAV
jgi:hypothetical protein